MVPIKRVTCLSFPTSASFLIVKHHFISLIYLDTAYKKLQRKHQPNYLCENHGLRLSLSPQKVIHEKVWMLKTSSKDHKASASCFNLPAWRFLCIQHWSGVDMKLMVITDSPWKQDTISDHAQIYYLTFGFFHPQYKR